MSYLPLGADTVMSHVCRAGPSPAQQAKACPASGMGPALVGSPCSPLAELTQDPHGGQARDGHRLASKRIPVLLELEEPPGTDGTTGCLEGNPRLDPRHEFRQRALGRTEAARGTAE